VSDRLDNLKQRLDAKRLRMIFAAESGSRAWGFASVDSDYDIRFVFSSEPDKYVSLFDPIQDINYQAPGDLDYSGWDLKKALQLASKSNPSMCEWLGSPIVYADPVGFRDRLRCIMADHFSPSALAHHYINFMRNIRGKYMADFVGEYTMKRYFYAMRPILVIKWMQDNPLKLPPVVFSDLLTVDIPQAVAEELGTMLVLKASAKEATDYKSPLIDVMVADWYERGHDIANGFKSRRMPIDLLDNLLRDTLAQAKP
jgi:uncharacterized protein